MCQGSVSHTNTHPDARQQSAELKLQKEEMMNHLINLTCHSDGLTPCK